MNNRQKLVQQQYLNNEKAVLRQLKKSYTDSLVAINDTVKNLQLSIDGLQQEYDWMDDNDPQKAIVKSKIQSKIYQKQYQEQLQSQVGGILSEMQRSQFVTVSDYLDKCYEDGFIGSIFDLHGQGVPLTMPINQESMVKAVQLDSKISKGLYTKLGEDVDVLKKRITSEVTRAIATGSTYAQTAQRLAGQTKIGFNKAARIARTEGHRIQNSAADDAAHLARDRGADVVKQWDSTLDGHTRESHVAVDGQIRELDEEFSNGLMFPGDPRGPAEEVIQCRCAYLQRARWAVGGSFTKMNNFTGQLETFDSPQDYDEFKKAFFSDENKKYMNYVEQMQGKYGTKDFATVLGSMTDREHKHYSNLLKSNPVYNKNAVTVGKSTFVPATSVGDATEYAKRFADTVNFDKLSLNACNSINEKLDDLTAKYDVRLPNLGTYSKGTGVAHANYKTLEVKPGYFNRPKSLMSDYVATIKQNEKRIAEMQEILETRSLGKQFVSKMQGQIQSLINANKFGRWGVVDSHPDDPIGAVITHEFGHFLADIFCGQINGERAWKDSGEKSYTFVAQSKQRTISNAFRKATETGDIYSISAYGAKNSHEFFAETFTMREYGETLPDYILNMLEDVLK